MNTDDTFFFQENEANIEGFESDFRDADGYLANAKHFFESAPSAHTLAFNIASLAMERYLLALCHLHGILPYNHNFTYLMNSAQRATAFPEDLNEGIRALDAVFGICSVDEYHHDKTTAADTKRILALCDDVRALTERERAVVCGDGNVGG